MRNAYGWKTVVAVITIIFLLLGLSIQFLMGRYRTNLLEPRLEQEARSQAEILARSQANLIAQALRQAERENAPAPLIDAFDELLLLNDPGTAIPFFESIEIQVDYDVVDADEGSFDLRRGETGSEGFFAEVPVFDAETSELMGVATFRVSERFFRQLAGDLRRELRNVSLAVTAILVFMWAVSLFILRKLQHQTQERLRAERELYQQEKKYERLVGSLSSYFVYGRDREGRLEFVSDSVQRVLGLSPLELMSQYRESLERDRTSDDDETETIFEVEIPDGDGNPHHLELSEVRVRDAAGRTEGYDGIARDVTTQRQFQEELRLAKDQAEAANSAKSMFLANMSHEIRTPLNAIVGLTAITLKGELAPKLREQLHKIRSSAHLLTDIIEDILDLSRIEAGRMELQRSEFDLDELLAELSDVVGMKLDHDLEILFAADPALPRRLRGDPVRLKQVLLNLLNNALKFTRAGEVVVEIEPVATRRDFAEIRFSVRDTGIGIAPEHLPTLFDPFSQVDGSMTRRFGGAGLGLAISSRLVRMMGGELKVESAPGEGSVFSFHATFDLPRGALGPRRLADEFRGLPVLVADDNPHARAILGDMLRSLSCEVTEVATGGEAVERAKEASRRGKPFRLAVLDWVMPDLDGAEAAARMNARPSSVRMPTILVTAFDREEAARQAERAGIDVVLHKPVSPSTLHDAVVELLDPRARRDRTERGRVARRFRQGQRVLLAEDNVINREVARELLMGAGLTVTEAHNGREALEILETQPFDAVLMDVQMPEMDGLETVRRIRENPVIRDLPVIAMTAHAMLGDRERFLAAGMSDYVSKPIEEHELLEVLSRRLASVEEEEPAGAGEETQSSLPSSLPGLAVSEGIGRASGNERLYSILAKDFSRQYAGFVPRLQELIASGEQDAIMAELHTIKGAAATLGARELARAAAGAEAAARSRGIGAIAFSEIEAALGTALASIDELERLRADSVEIDPDELASDSDLEALFDRMESYLAQNNLAAIECFHEVKRQTPAELHGLSRDLDDSLDRLDFEAARDQLATMRLRISGKSERA